MFVGSANNDEEAVGTSASAIAVRKVIFVFFVGDIYQIGGILGAIRRQSA